MRSRGPLAPVEVALASLAWTALVLGLAVVVLAFPVYTSAMVQVLGVPKTAGLSVDDTVHLSALVRSLVADQEADPLPAEWRGQPAFDAASVSHLEDVRIVMAGARLATGLAAALLAIQLALSVAYRRWDVFASGMRGGAIVTAAVVLLGGGFALLDFDSFFTFFHGLFFKAGTWTFPADSLLIRLFPERFWVTAGASWAALSLAGAVVLALAARYVPRAVRQVRGSRKPEDV